MEHMHSLGFMHRDLKLENFLICHDGYLKMADFGFAKQLAGPGTQNAESTPIAASSHAWFCVVVLGNVAHRGRAL